MNESRSTSETDAVRQQVRAARENNDQVWQLAARKVASPRERPKNLENFFQVRLEATEGELRACRAELLHLQNSSAWAVAVRLSRLRRRLAPDGGRRHRALQLMARGLRLWKREGVVALFSRSVGRLWPRASRGSRPAPTPADEAYQQWIAQTEPGPVELMQQRAEAAKLAYRPLISVLTPVYNTPPDILRATVASLLAQTYDHWELCLVDGGSTGTAVRKALKSFAADPRVRIRHLPENRGISGNTNEALALACGEFVALLDHDDVLAPFALFEVVRRLNAEPDLDFLYSDRDEIAHDGSRRFNALFKPDWSPELMLAANYLTHLCVIRTQRARQVGGFRPDTDGAQDWDFFLRVLEGTSRIAHIPKVLYHWRHWPSSCSSGIVQAKPYVLAAQQRTLNEHMARAGRPGTITISPMGHNHRLGGVVSSATVAAIVSCRDAPGRLPELLAKLRASHPRITVEPALAHIGPLPGRLRDCYDRLESDGQARVFVQGESESVATLLNRAARGGRGKALLFLDVDIDPMTPDWLDELLLWLEQPGVGVVGGKVLGLDGLLRHGALVLGPGGEPRPLFGGLPECGWNLFGITEWYRNCSAVSGSCLMTSRDLFEDVGGFDETYQQGGHDVDLCLKILDHGHRIVYNPHARFRAEQGGDRVDLSRVDLAHLHQRWALAGRTSDPYYNPNLTWHASPPALGYP